MKIDEVSGAGSDTELTEDRQNRREFFNSLGKWSMIVVATASFLRGSVTQANATREDTPRPKWGTRENVFPRLAKRKHRQHVDVGTGHIDTPHQDVPHVDYKIQQGGGVRPSPSGQPPKATE